MTSETLIAMAASGAIIASAIFGLIVVEMPIRFGAICKHCGESIWLRNQSQGWLHNDNESKCRATYATPVNDPTKGRNLN